MSVAVLSLGSNIGDRLGNITAMQNALEKVSRTEIISSPLYESSPLEVKEEQENYYNKVVKIETDETAFALLEITQNIERELGRENKGQKLARTADIDILLFDDRIISEKELTVPHPRLFFRRFVLEGVKSVAADMLNPLSGEFFADYCIPKEIFLQNLRIME